MHCRNCDYLLFNLTQPVCPECGLAFDTAEYRFEPSAVAFHCPFCDQAYYGNDAQGLPSPRDFNCVGCQRPIQLNMLRVVPQTPDAVGTRADQTPWDRRRELGTVTGWWEALKMVMTRPAQFFRLQTSPSVSEAWYFALISICVGLVTYALFYATILGLILGIGTFAAGPAGAPLWMLWLPMLIGLIAGPLLGPFVLAGIAACTIHMALFFLAPQRRDMGRTFRAAMYCLGPYVLYAIPMCGSTFGMVWILVLLIFAVKEVHQTSGWVAAVAVLWPVLPFLGLYVAFFTVSFVSVTSLP